MTNFESLKLKEYAPDVLGIFSEYFCHGTLLKSLTRFSFHKQHAMHVVCLVTPTLLEFNL